MECPICLEVISNNSTITRCNHTFHCECLNRWKLESDRCPTCRTSMTTGIQQRFISGNVGIPLELTPYIMMRLRDSVRPGSFEHGYYSAMYERLTQG